MLQHNLVKEKWFIPTWRYRNIAILNYEYISHVILYKNGPVTWHSFIWLLWWKGKKIAIIGDIQSRTNIWESAHRLKEIPEFVLFSFYTKNGFPPKVCFDQTMISSYGSRWMNSKSKWIGWRIRNCNNARKQILDFSRNLRLTAWTCVAWISFSTSVPPQIQIQILMLRFLVRRAVLWMQFV